MSENDFENDLSVASYQKPAPCYLCSSAALRKKENATAVLRMKFSSFVAILLEYHHRPKPTMGVTILHLEECCSMSRSWECFCLRLLYRIYKGVSTLKGMGYVSFLDSLQHGADL